MLQKLENLGRKLLWNGRLARLVGLVRVIVADGLAHFLGEPLGFQHVGNAVGDGDAPAGLGDENDFLCDVGLKSREFIRAKRPVSRQE